MANFYGVNITNLDASPAVLPDADDWHGKVRVQHDQYEAASIAAGSVVYVARLPAGARVVNWTVKADALGSSVTLKLGDTADDDRYLGATTYNTANLAKQTLVDGLIAGVMYQYAAQTDLIITTAGATANGTIESVVEYVVN
tara:strand:- start:2902 stop:3327 length:426 start_codon:yes stop_codon:yes gene_type:complete